MLLPEATRPGTKDLVRLLLGPIVQRLDNAIHRINHYPADSVVCFVNTYPLIEIAVYVACKYNQKV